MPHRNVVFELLGLPCPALGCISISLVDQHDRFRHWELAR
jgi:hypothetical protein